MQNFLKITKAFCEWHSNSTLLHRRANTLDPENAVQKSKVHAKNKFKIIQKLKEQLQFRNSANLFFHANRQRSCSTCKLHKQTVP